jgi:hypothetical protein
MLKTVKHSANKKTGPIAVTYRAGGHNVFATCPKTCALNPQGEHAADLIDADYLQAVRQAVPRNGQAWTYSHFPAELLPVPAPGETVINASCDTIPRPWLPWLPGPPGRGGRPGRYSLAVYPGRGFVRTVPGRAGRNFRLRPDAAVAAHCARVVTVIM